jgi:hypothetical protein
MPALAMVGVLTVILFLCFPDSVIALAQRAAANSQIGKRFRKQEGVTDTPGASSWTRSGEHIPFLRASVSDRAWTMLGNDCV